MQIMKGISCNYQLIVLEYSHQSPYGRKRISMLCKFCNQEVEKGLEICPFCGKNMTDEIAQAEQPEAQENETAEVTAENVPESEPKREEQKQKRGVLPLILSIIAAVAAIGALAVVLLIAMGVDFKPRENDIFYKEVYTVEDEKAENKSNVVVATMGDKELTNIQLQLYYRMQVMDFLNYYGSYASQIGLDYTKPLSEQICYYDKEQTWEQYMIGVAIDTWRNYQALGLLAEEEGFTFDDEWQATLDQIPEDLKTQAEQDGYESVDALLQNVIGPGCNEAEYMNYVRLACLSNAYYMHIESTLKATDAEIDAYFAEKEAGFAQSGITKEMGMISDVRHILIMPKGGTVSEETGQTVYSDDEKAAAYAEAQRILEEWKNGEATEESFALFANTYSEDGGSNTTGGLYEGIAPGASYVESFLNWSIDMSRKVGDTDIVETEYGYHIMYYVAGEPYWSQVVAEQLMSERLTKVTDDAKEKWSVEIDYRKIFLAELKLS